MICQIINVSTFGAPEELWSSNNHVLEVLQRQAPVVVQVGLVDHLLAHHSHLVLRQLVAGEFVQRLLQVGLADEVVVVEILQAVYEDTSGTGRRKKPYNCWLVVLRHTYQRRKNQASSFAHTAFTLHHHGCSRRPMGLNDIRERCP